MNTYEREKARIDRDLQLRLAEIRADTDQTLAEILANWPGPSWPERAVEFCASRFRSLVGRRQRA